MAGVVNGAVEIGGCDHARAYCALREDGLSVHGDSAPTVTPLRTGGRDGVAAPSVSYSITVRLEVPAGGQRSASSPPLWSPPGGSVTALDVTRQP